MSCSKEPLYVCCDDNNASQNAYGCIDSFFGKTLTVTAYALETVTMYSYITLTTSNC